MSKTPTDRRLTDEESSGLKALAFWLLILVLAFAFRHRILSVVQPVVQPVVQHGRAALAHVEDQASRVFLSRHTRCLAEVSRSGDGEDPKARQTFLRGCLKDDPQDLAVKQALRDFDADSNYPADKVEGRKLDDELATDRAGSMADVEKQVQKEMARRAKLHPDQQEPKVSPMTAPQQPPAIH